MLVLSLFSQGWSPNISTGLTALSLVLLTISFTLLLREVRQRMRNEVALTEAKAAALKTAQLKSMFLANVSHEVRTPLTGILGMAKLLEKTDLTNKQVHYVDTMQSAGKLLLTLINQILDLTKLEAGKIELENIHFELSTLVRNTMAMVEAMALEKGLRLTCSVTDEVPAFVQGDPLRLR